MQEEFQNIEQTAIEILHTLRGNGFQALFAGGCVRDKLMGNVPKDYDIATDATPDEVLKLFPKSVPVGAQFGVVMVISGGTPFEIATFRKDGAYSDGRHPDSVTFSSPLEDAKRRDFTINGLFYDPIEEKTYDFVKGKKDLERRILRTIGDPSQRFTEDKLRLMRAARFSANLDFRIDGNTRRTMEEMAATITAVSKERIRDELLKILLGPRPHVGIRLLQDTGILQHILPEISAMEGVQQPVEFHPEGDVFTHTLLMLEKMRNPSPVLALGVLLHDVGKPSTFSNQDRIRFNGHAEAGVRIADSILRRLRLSRLEREGVKDLVQFHMYFIPIQQMRISKMKRFIMRPDFLDHLELHRLDCLCSHKDLENWEFCKKKVDEISSEPHPLPPLVNGRDLIEMGYMPGPLFTKILTHVEDARLEGKIQTKEDAFTLIKNSFPR